MKFWLCVFLLVINGNIFAGSITIETEEGTQTIELDEIDKLKVTGTVTDVDGNVYKTLVIGEQEWMIENLRVRSYRNGDSISYIGGAGWGATNDGAFCIYDEDPSNAEIYGILYNGLAIDDPRGLAPETWHITSDEEIMQLEMHLGMSESEANGSYNRGTNEGSKLAGEIELWDPGELLDNPAFGISGFQFPPGGKRSYGTGSYEDIGHFGFLWSASDDLDSDRAYFRLLSSPSPQVYRNHEYKRCGFSVRCVRALVNIPPESPLNNNPSRNDIDVSVVPVLDWSCGDPDNDDLVYDVYLGTETNPGIVAEDLTVNVYKPLELECETTYYWKIIAKDEEAETESEIWQFTTGRF